MSLLLGKRCRFSIAFILSFIVATVCCLASGCNFFGKETPTDPLPAGQLPNGQSFVGTWSGSFADVNSSGVPTVAVTETFTFDASGTARLEIRSLFSNGSTCVGSGPFRLDSSNNIVIFIQAETCAMPPVVTFSQPSVSANYLSYKDAQSGFPASLYPDRAQQLAPVGVWQFNGQAGIDYMVFDPHGYFLMQAPIDGQKYLLQGYYSTVGGALTLNFFNVDPSQVFGQEVFSSYIIGGNILQLNQTTTEGDISIGGTLL